jgi:predicted MFS family arabinose efflux permease
VLTIVDTSGPALRVGTGLLALALLVGFVLRQRRVREPLVRLGIFASRAVAGGNTAQLLMVAGMLGFQFIAAQYLQNSLGYEPAAAGLAMLPIPLVIAVVSLSCSGRLIGRFGAFRVLVVGEALLVVGLLLLARPPVGAYALDVLPSMVILGIGAGLALPAVTTVMMSDATPADAGLASGLAGTSQQIGGALGTAVLAAVAAAVTEGYAEAGEPVAVALGSGYRVAFVVGAASVAAAVAVTAVVLGRKPTASHDVASRV